MRARSALACVSLFLCACSGGPRPQPPKDAAALPGRLHAVGVVHTDTGLIVGGTAQEGAVLGQTPLTPGPGGLIVGVDGGLHPVWGAGLGGGQVTLQAFAPGPNGDVVFTARFLGAFGGGGTLIKSHGKADCVAGRVAPTGEVRWVTHLGGAGEDDCPGLVATDSAVFVAGSFGPMLVTPRLDAQGGRDGFVTRLSAKDGQVEASVAFGAGGDEQVLALALKGSTLAVVGTFNRDFQYRYAVLNAPMDGPGAFIAGLDVDLKPTWARVVGRALTRPVAVAGTVDRGWVVAGTVAGAGFITGLDKGGNAQWRRDLAGWSAVHGLAVDGSDVLVAGAARGVALKRLSGSGEPLDQYTCGDGADAATAIAINLSGDVAWAGQLAKAARCGPAGGVVGRWGGLIR